MKKKIMFAFIVSLVILSACAKKEPAIVQKVTEIEAGSNISLEDLVTVNPKVESAEPKGTIETVIPGTYDVVVIVKEKDKSEEITITYTVVDTTAPVISQSEIPKVKKDSELVFSDFISIIDNSGEDLSAQLNEIKVDTAQAGDFEAKCSIKDSSGNVGTLLIKYTVIADTPPIVIQYYVPTIPQGYSMKLSDFLGVEDDSGEDFIEELNAVKMDTSTIGKHEVLFKVTDSAGNEGSLVFKYTVVAPNVFVSGFTYNVSYMPDYGKLWEIQVKFNALSIVDKIGSLADISGYKYVVMDLTIKNTSDYAFSERIFYTTEFSEPVYIAREITFSNGEKIVVNPFDMISVDSKKTFDRVWDPGESWRVYYYISVPDDNAKLKFEISVPIGCTKFSYKK